VEQAPADADATLDEAARWIVSRGLATPAVLFLELHRPLANISSQAMVVGGGVLAPLLGLERFAALREMLADDAAYEAFLRRLEELAREERS
jgi:hypothetical protein